MMRKTVTILKRLSERKLEEEVGLGKVSTDLGRADRIWGLGRELRSWTNIVALGAGSQRQELTQVLPPGVGEWWREEEEGGLADSGWGGGWEREL
ncbi:hypothetical protein MLD38_028798 [Melastoma candidum]|uniref:Uncharacterized protein n=1 Tax=Melastoma candidum TaxID=119954 RepID=A0ACB9N3E4_9MYRT|nr:hypothetical protein MLD38_028798 [Melastoma candidum]